MSKKVAIYTRVSTTNQAEEGYSIDEQIDKLKMYCEAMDWKVSEIYTDAGFSGSKLTRPAMEKMITDIGLKKFDTVIVYKLDRLSRSVRDTLYLVKDVFTKNEIDFISLSESIDTSSAMGSLFLTILSAINEFERENIKERMTMGKIGRAKSGKSMMWAKTAFGYSHNQETGILEINPLEASIVEQIFNEYLKGTSITKLRDKLNEDGHIAKELPWSYRTIRQTLDNPVYCGYIKYKNNTFEGLHKPIISHETFLKVQKELEARQQQTYEKNNNPRPFQAKYLLSGIARCGYCGAPLRIVLGHRRKDGSRTMKYQCVNRFPRKTKGVTTYNDNKKCDSGAYDMQWIEDIVLKTLNGFQKSDKKLRKILNIKEETKVDTSGFQKQLKSINNKIQKNSDLYLNDFITMDDLKKRTEMLQGEKKLIQAKINEVDKPSTSEIFDLVKSELGEIPISKISYEDKKKIVNNLISKVDVTADNIDIIFKFQLA